MQAPTLDKKVEKFQDVVGSPARMGVSDFARSKEWRRSLPQEGCFEVVDRGDVVGYMLAPDLARALSAKISQLEERVEQAQVEAMFAARSSRAADSGDELAEKALAYFDEHADELERALDGD